MARKQGLAAKGRTTVVRMLVSLALVATAIVVPTLVLSTPAAAANPCGPPVANPVACENTQPGTPNWQVNSDDPTIAGFTTDISATPGGTVAFKVNTNASAYQINIFRLGYYQGIGARQVATLNVTTKTTQPACKVDPTTSMTDCGNWAVTATWNVPSTAVSGLYYAVLHRNDTGGENELAFVLRNDSSHSDILFQTSDETWEAYNSYGGDSLYTGTGPGTNGASYAVSYNRPLSGEGDENFIFNAEVPMVYFLEQNGYDVSYTTDVDSARNGALIKNHKTFMSVGHDEYWSNEQRANVQAALDAGVNAAFMTGNDTFWKTRWGNSVDGSNTAWRSVICYKETEASAKIDPTSTWTGSWRDPRFSPPSDGGRPENAMVGQMFQMNGYRSDSLQVPATYGKMRLWRNTAVARQTSGATYTFQPGTLGYEWDTVQDNGFQPAGVAELSSTTVTATGNYVLTNYGDNYAPGTLTHHLTMYRDAVSHSLVFSAGDVQWAWGLADNHAFQTDTPTSDAAMQQATVNLLADEGVQPATLMTGLAPATQSTDTTAPTVAVTNTPTPIVGAQYTFSGTVTDSGGGQVANVEASSDGGQTWHYATWSAGTSTWSYSFVPSQTGSVTVEARAVDDSANLSAPVSKTLTVNPRTCPCGVFADSAAPTNPAANDSTELELGMQFQSSEAGYVTGVRFYKGTGNTGTHTGTLWTAGGQKLASGTFTNETASGWQNMTFARSVAIQANTTYVVSYHAPSGHYAADNNYFTNAPAVLQPMTGLQGSSATPNGVFSIGPTAFPASSYQNSNYWVDPIFNTTPAPNIQPPNVLANDPANGTGSVSLTPAIDVTFDEPVVQSSLQFTVSGSSGNVAGTVSLSSDGMTATFTPSAALAASTTYNVSVKATDSSGNVMPSPFTWSFTTGKPRPATCPCTVWDDFTTPQTAATTDSNSVELGTKVRFDVKGQVFGVRFYKGPGNTGTHVGSLWSSTGTLLASGTFTNETASGWQSLNFSAPVNVNSNTTYVVAYYAPSGHYSATPGYFGGHTATYNQLHAIADGTDGGNGVYMYTSGSAFPGNTYNANNYWVDVLWSPGANGDTTPPSVTSTTPGTNATGASLSTPVSATFGETVDPTTAEFTLADPAGAKLSGTTTLSSNQQTLTFTPSAPLAPGTTYTASVQVADVDGGNLMPQPYTWSFTATSTVTCPCSLFSAATVPTVVGTNDPHPYELGVKFTPQVAGTISGVKFYKSTQNTGTHTGNLYTSTGTLLATGTYTNETASGWQTLTFATPVTVTAGTEYVASYTTTTGFYSGDNGYFDRSGVNTPYLLSPADTSGDPNGVFSIGSGFPTDSYQGSNYWVDVVFNKS